METVDLPDFLMQLDEIEKCLTAEAPLAVSMSLNAQNAQGSVCDWVYSRRSEEHTSEL